jgi:hypothetical protein
MKQLTGVGTAVESGDGPLTVNLERAVAPYTAGLRLPLNYGLKLPVSPRFPVVDAGAQVLGRMPDGRPGLAAHRGEGWVSVYSAAPCLPAAVLRALCLGAGVSIYSPTDAALFARPGFLAVERSGSGKASLKLPDAATLLSWPGRRELSRGAEEATLENTAQNLTFVVVQ